MTGPSRIAPTIAVMSPVPAPVRLGTEAGRALAGLWFVVASLVGAQPLYRWIGAEQPAHPELALLCALALATLCCLGIGMVGVAGFRALMHAISPRPVGEKTSVTA